MHVTTGCELKKTYARRFESRLAYRNQVWRLLVDDFFQSFVPRDASVLDLGCGYGVFINAVACAAKYGMDLNPDARNHLDPSVRFFEQDCSTTWPLETNTLDVVFTSNFLEHLPSKQTISQTFSEAYRCLRPGGRFIAMGPNIKYLPGEYWDFFDHHMALTELSLQEGLELAGFQCDQVVGRFLPYTMATGPTYPLSFLRMYLHLRFAWRFFGKQFLVVATK
jgi:SAM-dependent methyltransferase